MCKIKSNFIRYKIDFWQCKTDFQEFRKTVFVSNMMCVFQQNNFNYVKLFLYKLANHFQKYQNHFHKHKNIFDCRPFCIQNGFVHMKVILVFLENVFSTLKIHPSVRRVFHGWNWEIVFKATNTFSHFCVFEKSILNAQKALFDVKLICGTGKWF